MAYLVVAYPELSKSDLEWIENYRREYDELNYGIIGPHITLVFPTSFESKNKIIEDVEAILSGVSAFDIEINCALINKDSFSDYWHVFLTPDKGFSDIVKIHDKLYSESLKESLMMEVQFVPHVGIGSSKDKMSCKALVDEFNGSGKSILGRVKEIDIIWDENDVVTTLKKVKLDEA